MFLIFLWLTSKFLDLDIWGFHKKREVNENDIEETMQRCLFT